MNFETLQTPPCKPKLAEGVTLMISVTNGGGYSIAEAHHRDPIAMVYPHGHNGPIRPFAKAEDIARVLASSPKLIAALRQIAAPDHSAPEGFLAETLQNLAHNTLVECGIEP